LDSVDSEAGSFAWRQINKSSAKQPNRSYITASVLNSK
jgi:hypothetical protein